MQRVKYKKVSNCFVDKEMPDILFMKLIFTMLEQKIVPSKEYVDKINKICNINLPIKNSWF